MVGDIAFIVVGAFFIAGSRWVADNFKIPGEHGGATGAMLRFGGLYDNYSSQLYRWVTCVVVGCLSVGVGVAGLLQ